VRLKILLIAFLSVSTLASLSFGNYSFGFPPAFCLGCDNRAVGSVLGWPAVFRSSRLECIGGDPNRDGYTRIGCTQETKYSYRYNGLAVNILTTVLIGIGIKAYVDRLEKFKGR
jgi:hypothetical protein